MHFQTQWVSSFCYVSRGEARGGQFWEMLLRQSLPPLFPLLAWLWSATLLGFIFSAIYHCCWSWSNDGVLPPWQLHSGPGGVAADSQKHTVFVYGVGGLGSGTEITVRLREQTRVFICWGREPLSLSDLLAPSVWGCGPWGKEVTFSGLPSLFLAEPTWNLASWSLLQILCILSVPSWLLLCHKMQSSVGSWELPAGMLGACWTLQLWKPSQSMQMINTCLAFIIPPGNPFPSKEPSEGGHVISKDYFMKGLFLSSLFWKNRMPNVPTSVAFLSFALVVLGLLWGGNRGKRELAFVFAFKSAWNVFSQMEN